MMTPTNRLRFVERQIYNYDAGGYVTVRILQQWWLDASTNIGEWRDVPLEQEI